MSFCKAKIQRFNEVKAIVPGASKTVSDKTKPKNKVNPTNHCDKAKSDTGSSQSVPCFRTPTLLRKKLKTISTNQALKTKQTELTGDQKLEALKEKIVECENKDAYIKDLTQQLEEFKEKINKMENDSYGIARFEQTIENLKNEHENKVKIIQEEFRLRLSDTILLKEKIATDLSQLKTFVLTCKTEMDQLKSNYSDLPNYLTTYWEQYQKTINQKQAELENKESLLKILEQSSMDMQKKHSIEIEKLRKEHQLEIQDLEFEMLQTMTELQKQKETSANKIKEMEEEMVKKISEMRVIFESDLNNIVCQSEKKLLEMEKTCHNSNMIPEKVFEQKITEIESEWKNKLSEQQKQSDAILKECQAISEYTIIECEFEKKALNTELQENIQELKKVQSNYSDILGSFNELKNTYKELKQELNLKKKELEATKNELQSEIQGYMFKLNESLRERVAYEFTIKNSQVTIDVLKRRLIHSDKDVEQLKQELADCEKKILEYEQKNFQLSTELRQSQLVNEELEMQFESTIKLNCTDINKLGSHLLKEVDDYKKEVIRYKRQIQAEQDLKKEIMQQLHDAYDMINRIKIELENIETESTHYKFEVEQSQNELDDYHMREMDWNIIRDKLELTIKELEKILEIKELDVNNFKKELARLQEKADSYLESSEYYKLKFKELEKDQEETGNIHKKYIEMSGKYDILAWKFEELEAENLQNKMKLMKLSDDRADTEAFKVKYEHQVSLCNELGQANQDLEAEIGSRLKEESLLNKEFIKLKTERDALLNKVRLLENELKQCNTPKKSKKKQDEENCTNPKKWIKKNKHPNDNKENLCSPVRTLNSPLRERN